MQKRLLTLLLAAALFLVPAEVNAFADQTKFTNTCAPIQNTTQTITLTDYSTSITIAASSGGSDIHVNFAGGAATTSHFKIPAGSAFTYQGEAVKTFTYIGVSASGTIGIFAHP